MKRFEQQTVVITGAASGIGRACAQRFAAEGAFVALIDREAHALETTRSQLADPQQCAVYALDIADESGVERCIGEIWAERGRIDVLCNNAGISGHDYSKVVENDTDNWRAIFEVNLMGTVFMTRAVSRHMKSQGAGAIVNTASVAGLRSGAGGNAYSASKAAVISLTQTTASDLGEGNIRVNAVCPGLIKTGMTQPVFDYAAQHDKVHKLGSRCELRRYGRPEEIASAVAFLASEDASYVTGQALPVDGGNTSSLNMPGMKV